MEVSAVLKFFGLSYDSSIADLDAVYGRYLSKYHPKHNKGQEEWAVNMTKKLKEAYRVAHDHLTSEEQRRSPPVIAAKTTSAGTKETQRSSQKRPKHAFAASFFGEREMSSNDPTQRRIIFFNAFYEAVDEALEGIYLYYQYGLENIHLRHEGVRSYRFRTALRMVSSAASTLEELQPHASSTQDRKNLLLFTEFTNVFVQNMRIEKTQVPLDSSVDGEVYRRYTRASEILDRAIRDTFFEELRDTKRSSISQDGLELCNHEFMLILTAHLNSNWVTETAIKAYLLDVFTKLLNHSSRSMK